MSSTSPAPSQGAPAINPLQIALAFIKQYYKVLSTNNSLIHKFYKPESRISFSENCYSTAETHSFADIDEKTFAWASNSKVDLANGSIDAQESVGGDILVVVTGEMLLEGHTDNKLFVQTFFLKKGPRKNYSVLHDILRFLDREQSDESNEPEPVQNPPSNTVADEIPQPEEVGQAEPEPDIVPEKEMDTDAAPEIPSVENETKIESETTNFVEQEVMDAEVSETISEEEPSPAEALEEEEEENVDPVVEPENVDKTSPSTTETATPPLDSSSKPKLPGSWASLVAGSSSASSSSTTKPANTETPANTPVATSPSKSSSAPKKEKESNAATNTTAPEQPKKAPKSQDAEIESTSANAPRNSRASGYGSKGNSSLFIKHVGDGITESDLRGLFKDFDFKIVNVSFYPSRGYAFVDFEDSNAVNSIMKENRQTFQLKGRAVEVQKKSTDQKSSDRRRGSSAHGNNGSRGNGNSSSGNNNNNNSNSGGSNRRGSPKNQRQRSHSGKRMGGGADGEKKGRNRGSRGNSKRKGVENSGTTSAPAS